jgi:CheY-like chemotaxis protein
MVRREENPVNQPCVILLVEDDANDAFFVARALKELGFNGKLEHVADTEAARAYLNGQSPFVNRHLPEIVVSDASLSPRGTGVELLEWMRQEQSLGEIPFIILSGEVSPEIRDRANSAGVQAVLRKGSTYKETVESLREVIHRLPEACRRWLKPVAS